METMRAPPPASGLSLYRTLEGSGFLFDQDQRTAGLTGCGRRLLAAYAAGERPVSAASSAFWSTGCPIGGVLEKTVA